MYLTFAIVILVLAILSFIAGLKTHPDDENWRLSVLHGLNMWVGGSGVFLVLRDFFLGVFRLPETSLMELVGISVVNTLMFFSPMIFFGLARGICRAWRASRITNPKKALA